MTDSATKTETGDAHGGDHGDGEHEHHSLPLWMLGGTLAILMVLTVVTVAAAYVDLGDLNVPLAMFIATIKATFVALIFMHLRWDKPFNLVVLLTSIGMLALFLTMTSIDTSEYAHQMDASFGEKWMASERDRLKKERKVDNLYPRDAGGKTDGGGGGGGGSAANAETQKLADWAKKSLGSLPKIDAAKGLAEPKAKLGQLLYHDPRMSKSGTISCASCHSLDTFGQDGKTTSPGHDGTLGTRNSPTTLNAFLQNAGQFWDARVPDVEAQAVEPIKNPIEHGMTEETAVAAIKGVAGYAPLFKAAFPNDDDPITLANIGKAIGAFERLLVTRGRFDRFMEGELGAFTTDEIAGLAAFKKGNCIICHSGQTLGGNMKQKLGLVKPYPTKDKGLAEHTKRASDEFIFKVSQLRNIAATGPYFHDGSITTLEEAIKLMLEYQVPGGELSDKQVADMVNFLKALSGDLDPALKAKPTLPK